MDAKGEGHFGGYCLGFLCGSRPGATGSCLEVEKLWNNIVAQNIGIELSTVGSMEETQILMRLALALARAFHTFRPRLFKLQTLVTM